MNYDEALEYIHGTYKFGIKLGLENIRALLEKLGNPHKNKKIIHIAGTNGKGSTSSMIASILEEEGYKVGLYTSPYLEVFNERIKLNGENILNEDLVTVVSRVKEAVNQMEEGVHPTEFEVVTAAAFLYYDIKNVDFIVLEVGLGGQFDATNVIDSSLASVIVPISMDHMQYLGDTLPKIAFEKCGIIKNNGFVVTACQKEEVYDVIKEEACKKNAELKMAEEAFIECKSYDINGQDLKFIYGENEIEFKLPLLGFYQIENVRTVLVVIFNLIKKGIRIHNNSIKAGLEKCRWPGRFEIVSKKPVIILDGAHNVDGMKMLKMSLERYFNGKKVTLVIGILKDKEYSKMLDIILDVSQKIVFTEPLNERKLNVGELEQTLQKLNKHNKTVKLCKKPADALKYVLNEAQPDEVICIAGSLYLVGIARSLICN